MNERDSKSKLGGRLVYINGDIKGRPSHTLWNLDIRRPSYSPLVYVNRAFVPLNLLHRN